MDASSKLIPSFCILVDWKHCIWCSTNQTRLSFINEAMNNENSFKSTPASWKCTQNKLIHCMLQLYELHAWKHFTCLQFNDRKKQQTRRLKKKGPFRHEWTFKDNSRDFFKISLAFPINSVLIIS